MQDMNDGQKLFEACNFKGTFANCKAECCVACHKDKAADLPSRMQDFKYVGRLTHSFQYIILDTH